MRLVSVDQASRHLRRDTLADDPDLEDKIEQASAAVIDYLDVTGTATFLDSSGDPEVDSAGDVLNVPRNVQAATLLMIGYLYRNRDSDPDKAFEAGCLPRPVTALLFPLRKPVFA